MSRPPRRPHGPVRRAPLRRGIPQRSAPTPAAEPPFAVIKGSDVFALARPALGVLIEQYGTIEAALDAVANAERPVAEVVNALTRQGHGKAARLALGMLWHLFLMKQAPDAQASIQAAAATLADRFADALTRETPGAESSTKH